MLKTLPRLKHIKNGDILILRIYYNWNASLVPDSLKVISDKLTYE